MSIGINLYVLFYRNILHIFDCWNSLDWSVRDGEGQTEI